MKHIISVPCESHSLQLIIKDLLDPGKDDNKQDIQSDLCDFWKEEQSIITFFHKAPKQLGILRKKQMTLLNKFVALSSAGITRWGTQVCIISNTNRCFLANYSQWNQVEALLKNKETLRLYVADARSECKSIESFINDRSFWDKLKGLQSLLKPIHEAQKMSESTHSTLDKVYPRWVQIQSHLNTLSQPGSNPWAHEVAAYMRRGASGWIERTEKQIVPVYIVAYILNPANRSLWYDLAAH
jgi:hypothetical protein